MTKVFQFTNQTKQTETILAYSFTTEKQQRQTNSSQAINDIHADFFIASSTTQRLKVT